MSGREPVLGIREFLWLLVLVIAHRLGRLDHDWVRFRSCGGKATEPDGDVDPQLCAGCPVWLFCLADRLMHEEARPCDPRWFIAGGLGPDDRERLCRSHYLLDRQLNAARRARNLLKGRPPLEPEREKKREVALKMGCSPRTVHRLLPLVPEDESGPCLTVPKRPSVDLLADQVADGVAPAPPSW